MADNDEHICFLQALLGYGVTGEVKEHIFAFFIGTNRCDLEQAIPVLLLRSQRAGLRQVCDRKNGKALCLDVMNSVLGDRFVFPGHKALLFADEPACNVDEQRARLAGVRTLVWNESSKDRVMHVASMQMLSGGDTFNAKPMYGRATTVVPRFLPVLATNWLPRLP